MELMLFEKYSSYFDFDDGNVRVHKIKNGPNRGKIRFYFQEEDEGYSKWSMGMGCNKLLDTKYAENEEIRKITLGHLAKFNKLQPNTTHAIIKNLISRELKKLNLPDDVPYSIMNKVEYEFKEILKNIALDCKNLGEVIDKLKNIDVRMSDFIYGYIKQIEFDDRINKYNL